MEPHPAAAARAKAEAGGPTRAATDGRSPAVERHPVGAAHRSAVERAAQEVPAVPDVPPVVSGLGEGRHLPQGTAGAGQRPEGAWRLRLGRGLRGRVLLGREKGGPCVGKTKRGKGTKVVAAVDGAGLPVAVGIASASPHEVKVLEAALDEALLDELPERLIGDKAYDSDKLDERLWDERGVKLIALLAVS